MAFRCLCFTAPAPTDIYTYLHTLAPRAAIPSLLAAADAERAGLGPHLRGAELRPARPSRRRRSLRAPEAAGHRHVHDGHVRRPALRTAGPGRHRAGRRRRPHLRVRSREIGRAHVELQSLLRTSYAVF